MSDGDARPSRVVLGPLGLHDGGAVLLAAEVARRGLGTGAVIDVVADDPTTLAVHGLPWCRSKGHRFVGARATGFAFEIGPYAALRDGDMVSTGDPDPTVAGAIADRAPGTWGLAARGARVDAATRPFSFALAERDVIWTDDAPHLYAQATAAQWDPATAIPWHAPRTHDAVVEAAIVQVMTYLVENETAALLVPARFLAQVHPHFREIMQLLAVQVADEARHIEVFTRRARLHGATMGTSSAGGQASLQTLVEEPDFALAMFLLSVLGEGSFLSLLWFLREHAPDPVTEAVARLAAQDEARHVAFGLGHLGRHLSLHPELRGRLATAVQQRHDALADTAGLNADVFDALVVIAAGRLEPEAIGRGFAAVAGLVADMDHGRRKRLARLGFSADEAAALSELHTRNFM
jgi:hypothetical protein